MFGAVKFSVIPKRAAIVWIAASMRYITILTLIQSIDVIRLVIIVTGLQFVEGSKIFVHKHTPVKHITAITMNFIIKAM